MNKEVKRLVFGSHIVQVTCEQSSEINSVESIAEKTIENLGELSYELIQLKKGRGNKLKISDQVADVQNMLWQLIISLDLDNDAINEVMYNKLVNYKYLIDNGTIKGDKPKMGD